jgi:hypothetical protein
VTLSTRLARLEQAAAPGGCAVCRGSPPTGVVREWQPDDARPDPCPGCGESVTVLVRRVVRPVGGAA